MFTQYKKQQFKTYSTARQHFIDNPEELISIEKHITDTFRKILMEYYDEMEIAYNEASYTYPFWKQFAPFKRGRQPRGDQVPWIEVGEQIVGGTFRRKLENYYKVSNVGLPSGADDRIVVSSPEISSLCSNITDSVMIFIDEKSTGPRDTITDLVVSPYQVSGDGIWKPNKDYVVNSLILAKGKRSQRDFYPAVSPIVVTHTDRILPIIHIFTEPIYSMISLNAKNPSSVPSNKGGQPLSSIRITCVPNGLLLTCNPNYVKEYPHLFYPGKDESGKAPLRVRARIDTNIISEHIAKWRVFEKKR